MVPQCSYSAQQSRRSYLCHHPRRRHRRGQDRPSDTHRIDGIFQRASWTRTRPLHHHHPPPRLLLPPVSPYCRNIMCFEPKGLWCVSLLTPSPSPTDRLLFLLATRHRVVELIPADNVKTITLDEDTKITNVCLSHDTSSRSKDFMPSSIKLRSNGHVGTICTLTPTKVCLLVLQSFQRGLTIFRARPNKP